jgi:serine/threonine-protein kinase haspin
MLSGSQVYAIIVLPNGGPDLEAYSFSQPAKTGWSQACSLFWQITRALAMAEKLVSFEVHRLYFSFYIDADLRFIASGSSLGPDSC